MQTHLHPSAPVKAVAAAGPVAATITPEEFTRFRDWLYRAAGISLSERKRALVMGRLASRLRHFGLSSYGDYFRLLTGGGHLGEPQVAVDLLTTNETHFFREPKHFDFLRDLVLPAHRPGRMLRAWSAASSTGEEPYSIAMTLAEGLGEGPWEVVASDLSSRALARARTGHYALARAKSIPAQYLRTYCLKGVGGQDGTFLVEPRIRTRVQFLQVNLNESLPDLGEFDLVFLRNVMIYFDLATKRQVVGRIVQRIRPGGHLVVGHAESLNGICDALKLLRPSIYRRD